MKFRQRSVYGFLCFFDGYKTELWFHTKRGARKHLNGYHRKSRGCPDHHELFKRKVPR